MAQKTRFLDLVPIMLAAYLIFQGPDIFNLPFVWVRKSNNIRNSSAKEKPCERVVKDTITVTISAAIYAR